MAFRFERKHFHLDVSEGDYELRFGGWMLTILWNGRIEDGGVFLQTKRGSRHWSWADLRGSFTSGRELPSAPSLPARPHLPLAVDTGVTGMGIQSGCLIHTCSTGTQ